MKKILLHTLSCLVAVALLSQTGCAQDTPGGGDSGTQALDFTLTDVNGRTVRLGDFVGRNVILLVFSATWCPPCNKEVPELKKLHDEYGPKGLKIIDVYIQESQEKIASFVQKNAIPYTIVLDLDGAVARQYGVRGIPTFVVIDKTGAIKKRGYPPSRQYVAVFEKLLEE
jgi:peroxiredoxin